MRVLVVGGGGREHALVHSFARSPLAERVFCAPGNAGTALEAENVPVGSDDLPGLLAFARRESIDLTVIGPEAPLVDGLADLFAEHGLAVFGPGADGARLEGSKVFAKEIMYEGGVPTGRFRRHESLETALECLALQESWPLVVKADGLAAGKGVLICHDFEEAKDAIESCLIRREFGASGDTMLIEEFLEGSEVSLLVLCDGTTAVPLAPAQDYKRIFAGDQGPNTGGMGSYCPVPGFGPKAVEHAMDQVVQPTLEALAARGITYRGVLYAGLIITGDGMKVLEFNCRFGDPETQAVLPRLDSDLLELCAAAAAGELAGAEVRWKPQDCVTVVLASAGYPASSHKGDVITGLDEAAVLPGVTVFHAGTVVSEATAPVAGGGRIVEGPQAVTAGGRVLAVSALGDGFAAARERAYAAVDHIRFDGRQIRPDIAERAVAAQAGELRLFPPGFEGE
jgi:phosphoribosylamine--glycine ligase